MYTIGQVSQMTGLPVSTLRYYDQQGLFPELRKESGIRKFTDRELDILKMVECLKSSGLELRDIRQFIHWCAEGSATYPQRKAMFLKQKEVVEAEIQSLEKTLNMLRFKCWYYEQAIQDGSEDRIKAMLPDRLPPDIQALYDRGRA